jgi:pimeloyl-ACP methyl ester carboxylesterase
MIDTPRAGRDATPQPDAIEETFCAASRLRLLRAGSGERGALLLHGWGDSAEIWRSALAALAPHHVALAPDLPGHGGSPLAGAARMADLAGRVGALIAAQGFEQVDIVGHSMGGNVALELALARPELVRRLVLVAPAVLCPEMPAYTRLYLHPAVGWAALRASFALHERLAELARHVPREAALPYATLLHRSARTSGHDPEHLRIVLRGLFDNPLGPRLPEVRAETLVVNGELDLVVPAALSRRVAEAIPGARYASIARAAHHPMDERPREFERLLLAFLTK